MKRIKVLLVAMTAALALSAALGAGSASASGIKFSSYPATALAGEVGMHGFFFSGGRSLGCSFNGLSATQTGASETLAATVSPKECSNEFEGKVTMKMNGCKFIYHPAVD